MESPFYLNLKGGSFFLSLILVVIIASCSKGRISDQVFLPPSPPLPSPSTTFSSDTTSITPTQYPESFITNNISGCINDMKFLEDINFQDWSQVSPGQAINKYWLVENVGSCDWDENYRLKLISGDPLGSPSELFLFPAEAGKQIKLSVQFIAPSQAGSYQGIWQAYDPSDQPFGDQISIVISVQP